MTTRDQAVLEHVGRYGVGLRAVMERLFFGGKTSDNVLNRLLREGKLQVRGGLPDGLSYYQLSAAQARELGVPDHRSRPRRSRALREAIAVLWFCCMDGAKRTRIESHDLKEEFGKGRGCSRPHCAEAEGDSPTVRRLYMPGPNSRDKHLLKSIRIDYELALTNGKLAEWVQDEVFRFTILVETERRKVRLKQRIERNQLGHIPIDIFLAPGPTNLSRWIKKAGSR